MSVKDLLALRNLKEEKRDPTTHAYVTVRKAYDSAVKAFAKETRKLGVAIPSEKA